MPPQGAQIIFEAVLKTFAGISYDGVPDGANIGEFETVEDVLDKMGSTVLETVSREIN